MAMFTNTNRLMYLQSRYLGLNNKELVNLNNFPINFYLCCFLFSIWSKVCTLSGIWRKALNISGIRIKLCILPDIWNRKNKKDFHSSYSDVFAHTE